jgi:hypothetical protein
MTESEWLACSNPTPMLEFLRGKASDRKFRLFACACCRRIWKQFTDARCRHAVETAEQYAEGQADLQRLEWAREAIRHAFHPSGASTCASRAANAAKDATRVPGWNAARNCWLETSRAINPQDTNYCDPSETPKQADLLRDLFGNLFRPIIMNSTWLTWNDGTVVKIAQAIHDDRGFDRLPILADALEDAGCVNAEILTHCRGPGPHVRGCWVIDLLLGKE